MRWKYVEAIEYSFKASCFLVVLLMFVLWIQKYVDDKNVCLVDYIPSKVDHEALIPEMSLCFRKPFIEDRFDGLGFEVNTSTYLKHLTGEEFQEKYNHIEYNNVTVNLNDYFLYSTILWSNLSTSEDVEVGIRPIFNGRKFGFNKCFSINTKGVSMADVLMVKYIFENKVLIEYVEAHFDMFFKLHSPNQFLLLESDFTFITYDKNQVNGLYVEMDIQKLEVLKRRNRRNAPCMMEWNRWDQLTVLKQIKKVGCLAPYHGSLGEFPLCSRKEDLATYFIESIDPKSKLDYPPCQTTPRINPVIRQLPITENDEFTPNISTFSVEIFYPEQIMLITQAQSVDGQTVIGNIGGYIGLFLGIYYH